MKNKYTRNLGWFLTLLTVLLLYTNADSPTLTFAESMPKTAANAAVIKVMTANFLASFPKGKEPTQADWANFKNQQNVKAFVSKFKTEFIAELKSSGAGLKATMLEGRDELLLEKDTNLGATPLSNAIGVQAANGKKVYFDPVGVVLGALENTRAFVQTGSVHTFLTWLGMQDCGVYSSCAAETINHEIRHVQDNLDLSAGIESVMHGSVGKGFLSAVGLVSPLDANGYLLFDDGSGYDQLDGFDITELSAHDLQFENSLNNFARARQRKDLIEAYAAGKNILNSFGRARIFANGIQMAAGILFTSIVDGKVEISKTSGKIQLCFKNVCTILAHLSYDNQNQLHTPDGVITDPAKQKEYISQAGQRHAAATIAKAQQMDEKLQRQGRQIERLARALVQENANADTSEVDLVASLPGNVDAAINSAKKARASAFASLSKIPGVSNFKKIFQAAEKGSGQKNMTIARGVIPNGKIKVIPHPTRVPANTSAATANKPAPVIVKVAKESEAGLNLKKNYRDRPDIDGKDAVDATVSAVTVALSSVGVSKVDGQAYVVTDGSVVLSFDGDWYLGSNSAKPDYLFDTSDYFAKRLCPSCYLYRSPSLSDDDDFSKLVTEVAEDFYNNKYGSVHLVLRNPIEGFGSDISVGEVMGQRAAIFTQAAILTEKSKDPNMTQAELQASMQQLLDLHQQYVNLSAILQDALSGKLVTSLIDGLPNTLNDIPLSSGFGQNGDLELYKMVSDLGEKSQGRPVLANSGSLGTGVPGSAPTLSQNKELASTLVDEAKKVDEQTKKIADQNVTVLGQFPDQSNSENDYNAKVQAILPNLPNLNSVANSVSSVTNGSCGNMDLNCYNNLLNTFNNANTSVSTALNNAANTGVASGAVKTPDSLYDARRRLLDIYNQVTSQVNTENRAREQRNASKRTQAEWEAESLYPTLVRNNWFPVLYLDGGVYKVPNCTPVGGGSVTSCYHNGTGKTPKQLTSDEFYAAQNYSRAKHSEYYNQRLVAMRFEQPIQVPTYPPSSAWMDASANYNAQVSRVLQDIQRSITGVTHLNVDDLIASLKTSSPDFNKFATDNPLKAKAFVQSMIESDPGAETLAAVSNYQWETVDTPDGFFIITGQATATYEVDTLSGGMCPVF